MPASPFAFLPAANQLSLNIPFLPAKRGAMLSLNIPNVRTISSIEKEEQLKSISRSEKFTEPLT